MQKNLLLSGIALLLIAHTLRAQTSSDQWYHLAGPFGGEIRQLDTDGDQLYALTTGGIYQSPDAGAHWTLLEPTLKIARQARQFQVEKGMIYLLTTDGLVLRSGNAGAEWTTVLQPPYPYTGPGEQLLKLFAAGDTVLVGSVLSIYRSVDQGKSWQPSEVFFKQGFVGFSKINSDLYAAFDWFIRKSSDGGLNWSTVYSSSYFFGAMTAVDTVLYGTYDGYPRVIRSRDGGKSWDRIDSDSINIWPYPTYFLAGLGEKLFYLIDYGCIHGGLVLSRSSDGGSLWSGQRQSNIWPNRTRDIRVLPEHLLIGNLKGVFRSIDDGDSFSSYNDGMNASYIRKIFKTKGGIWWTQTASGIFRSTDLGATWQQFSEKTVQDPCYSGYGTFLGNTEKRLFRQECSDIMYTENDGDTWDTVRINPDFSCPDLAVGEHAVFLLTRDTLFRLDDDKKSLTLLDSPIDGSTFTDFFVYDDGSLFLQSPQKMYYSTNEGISWDTLSAPSQIGIVYNSGYWLDSDPDFVYMYFNDYLNGNVIGRWNRHIKAWERYQIIDPSIGDTISPWQIYLFTNTGHIRWLGIEDRGLYYTNTAMADEWHPYDPEFPATSPSALCLAGDDFWVGTAGHGIFRTKLEFKTPSGPAPHLTLYPNPSTGDDLHVRSDLFFASSVQLRMFDAAGRLLQDRTLPPGQYWSLDPPGVPAGVYFFQFLEGTHNLTTLRWVKGR